MEMCKILMSLFELISTVELCTYVAAMQYILTNYNCNSYSYIAIDNDQCAGNGDVLASYM